MNVRLKIVTESAFHFQNQIHWFTRFITWVHWLCSCVHWLTLLVHQCIKEVREDVSLELQGHRLYTYIPHRAVNSVQVSVSDFNLYMDVPLQYIAVYRCIMAFDKIQVFFICLIHQCIGVMIKVLSSVLKYTDVIYRCTFSYQVYFAF